MNARLLVISGILAGALSACSGSTGPAGTGRLTFQLTSRNSAAAAPTFIVGPDVIVLTQVQVVARKIRLERAQGTCPDAAAAVGISPSSGTDGAEENDSECAEVRLDPVLLAPPVDATAKALFSIDLPEGSYRGMKIQIHKPTPSSNDAALLAAHPEFQGLSVKVDGTFNGAPFSFTSSITAEVEIGLDTPVVVVAGTPAALTLDVDLSTWFAGGTGLLSPVAPTQQIRAQIEQNIRASFRAFKDHDHDGLPDGD